MDPLTLLIALPAALVAIRQVWEGRKRHYAQRMRSHWKTYDPNIGVHIESTYDAPVTNVFATVENDRIITDENGPINLRARRECVVPTSGSPDMWLCEDVYEEFENNLQSTKFDDCDKRINVRRDSKLAGHKVTVTFKEPSGKNLWARENGFKPVRLRRPLYIWAERTRTAHLEKHIDKDFERMTGAQLRFKSFANVEELQRKVDTLHNRSKLRLALSRRVPDIIVGPHDWLGRLRKDINPVVLTATQRASFSEVALEALTVTNDKGNVPKLYGVPYAMDSVALVINEELTSQVPATFEKLIELGKTLQQKEGLQEALALQVGEKGDPYHMWPLFSSAGGSLFGWNGKDFAVTHEWRDSFISALEAIRGFGEQGEGVLRREIGREEAIKLFLSRKTPFLVCSSRALAQIRLARSEQKDPLRDILVVPVPPLDADLKAARAAAGEHERAEEFMKRRSLVSVYGFFIYSRGRNKVFSENLVTYYLAQEDTGKRLYNVQPRPPVQKEAQLAISEKHPQVQAYIEQCVQGLLMPSLPTMRKVWDVLGKAEVRVVSGQPARSVAEKAIDEVASMLK
ncbi:MAG: extracellular solute-binding protein [Acidobacteria bacterium]|nr:extracellular solute-binding protein [Acidobacteriota bacterium]